MIFPKLSRILQTVRVIS